MFSLRARGVATPGLAFTGTLTIYTTCLKPSLECVIPSNFYKSVTSNKGDRHPGWMHPWGALSNPRPPKEICIIGKKSVLQASLYQFSRVALTKYHGLGDFKNNLLSHSSEARVRDPGGAFKGCQDSLFYDSLLASDPLLPISGFLGLGKHHPISAFIFTWCSPCVHVCTQMSPF